MWFKKLQVTDAEGWKVKWLNFVIIFLLEIQTILFEHINILTDLGFPFAHRDVIHTVYIYLKTESNNAFKTSMNCTLSLPFLFQNNLIHFFPRICW